MFGMRALSSYEYFYDFYFARMIFSNGKKKMIQAALDFNIGKHTQALQKYYISLLKFSLPVRAKGRLKHLYENVSNLTKSNNIHVFEIFSEKKHGEQRIKDRYYRQTKMSTYSGVQIVVFVYLYEKKKRDFMHNVK